MLQATSLMASIADSHHNTARMLSIGRSGIAAAGRNIEDVFVLNPALLATKRDLSFFSSYISGDDSIGGDQRQIHLGMLDSSAGSWAPPDPRQINELNTFPIASALTYTNVKNDHYRDQFFSLGVAQAMSANLAIGLLGTYSQATPFVAGGRKETFFDIGVGFAYKIGSRLSLGISAQNLLDSRKDFEVPFLRRAMGAGVQFKLAEFVHLRGDVWNSKDDQDDNQWIYRVGLENQFTDHFHFNLGFGKDMVLDTNTVGLGFSIVGPRLSLHYGFQRETSKDNALHSVDFHLPLW